MITPPEKNWEEKKLKQRMEKDSIKEETKSTKKKKKKSTIS